jgi:hypothetical protein
LPVRKGRSRQGVFSVTTGNVQGHDKLYSASRKLATVASDTSVRQREVACLPQCKEWDVRCEQACQVCGLAAVATLGVPAAATQANINAYDSERHYDFHPVMFQNSADRYAAGRS